MLGRATRTLDDLIRRKRGRLAAGVGRIEDGAARIVGRSASFVMALAWRIDERMFGAGACRENLVLEAGGQRDDPLLLFVRSQECEASHVRRGSGRKEYRAQEQEHLHPLNTHSRVKVLPQPLARVLLEVLKFLKAL